MDLFQSFPRKGMETLLAGCRQQPCCFRQLFQSFPRKGMETEAVSVEVGFVVLGPFFNHFPARGWKPLMSPHSLPISIVLLFQSFPRKGMETMDFRGKIHLLLVPAFSIISPQGDGNYL